MSNEKKYNISINGDSIIANDLSDRYEKKITNLVVSLANNKFPKNLIIIYLKAQYISINKTNLKKSIRLISRFLNKNKREKLTTKTTKANQLTRSVKALSCLRY